MSFIKQISKAIKKPKRCHPHGRVAVNFLFMFSFAVIGLSFLLYGTIHGQLAKAQSGDWYNSDWKYRQKLTIDHTKVAGDPTNFPIFVDVTSNNLKAIGFGGHVRLDAGDILFTDSSGTKLDHEIENYGPDTGVLKAWVEVNTLSSVADTEVYMYYGNATASNQANPTGVWDDNFKMVQHLSGSEWNTADSTVNNNDGIKAANNEPSEVAGWMHQAQNFDGINDDIRVAYASSLDVSTAMSFEGWIKVNNPGGAWQTIIAHSPTAGQYNYWFYLEENDLKLAAYSATYPACTAIDVITDSRWHYVAFTATKGGVTQIFVDGNVVASGTAGTSFWTGGDVTVSDLRIGRIIRLTGIVDEIRISDSVRSADWLKTAYNSENDYSTFVRFVGDEEEYKESFITIAFGAPTSASEWDIGDEESITWIVSASPSLPDHYALSYQEVGAGSWTPIADDLTSSDYLWEIPPVDNPGNNFMVQIEAYDATGNKLITAESDAFKIDYGPVYSWNFTASIEDGSDLYDLRDKLIVDTPFTLSAIAKDQYGNLITNYDQRLDLQVFSTAGVTLTPNTLGEAGNTGNWDNGTVSFGGYILAGNIPETGTPITIEITNQPPTAVGRTVAIQLFKYGTLVFAPDGNSNWKVGTSHEIKYLAGGTPPCGTEGCVEKLAYSQDGGANFDFIQSGGNDIEHPFSPIFRTDAWSIVEGTEDWQINPDNLDQKIFKVKAVIVDKGNDPLDDEVELSGSDITDAFTIGTSDALSGTYTSAKFNISDAPTADTFMSFETLSATYTEHTGLSDVEFALRFFDSQDQLLGASLKPEGWFVADGDDFIALLGVLNSSDLLSMRQQIKQIQFRIKMQTSNYEEASPWVEDVVLVYEIDTGVEVGTFNIDGDTGKSVAQGSHADFNVKVKILSNKDIVDANGMKIVTAYDSGAGLSAPDVNITTANYVAGEDLYKASVRVNTTSTTPPAPSYNIQMTISVNNHPEMTFNLPTLTCILTVTGATAQNFSMTWAGGADTSKIVKPGEKAVYNFIVTWDGNYTDDIALTTDAPTVIGTSYITKIEFVIAGSPTTRATKPPTDDYVAVALEITTKLNGGEKALTTFNITGTGDDPKNISPAPSLTISNQPANVVTIDAKAEVEGGTAASFTAPKFTIRLYKKGATSTYTEKTDVQAGPKDATTGKYVISASFDKATADANGKVVVGTTYIGYLRSTRHFWKKATTPTSGEITISAGTNSYTLEFPKLLAGDIAPTIPDNVINSLDFGAAIINFHQTMTNALNDFDNNGQINALDVGYLLLNYFKKGDLLPS